MYLKYQTTILLLLYCYVGFSQSDLANNLSSIPNRDANLSDNNAGLYTTQIPLFNFKGREFDLPVSMSYASSGIRVDQVASGVGLGWELNVGGKVDRIVIGNPDDHISGYFPGCQNSDQLESKLENRDYYMAAGPGLYDIFNFSKLSSPVFVGSVINPETHIELSNYLSTVDGSVWIITSADGTKYYYGQNNVVEKIDTNSDFTSILGVDESGGLLVPYHCVAIPLEYKTSWMLTKIVSKNELDVYEFDYQDFKWLSYLVNNGDGFRLELNGNYSGFYTNGSMYKINQQMVKEIRHNGDPIISFKYSKREDMEFEGGDQVGNALSEIGFYNYKSDEYYRKIDFEYLYFGDTNPSSSYLDKRLQLKKIKFKGVVADGTTTGDEYQFDYISPELVPPITSYAKDYLGLYNGKDANTNLLPGSNNINRKFDFASALIGTLYKVTYPNKGYSVLEYEQNALNGGYGKVWVPEHTTFTPTEVTDGILKIGEALYCDDDSNPSIINPSMLNVSFLGYPGGCYSQSNPRHCTQVRTGIMRISNAGIYNMEKSGNGLYMVTKIENCDATNDAEPCFYDASHALSSMNPCLVDTSATYYLSNSSFPATNISAGTLLSCVGNNEISLEAGTYQITIWSYPDFAYESASVRIYHSEDVPVYHSGYFVDQDVTSGYVDGFRIASVTNYSGESTFAAKKLFKYSGGISDIVANTYDKFYPFLGNVHFETTKGYVNAPKIMHYSKTYEAEVDSLNNNRGYVETEFPESQLINYPFHNANDPQGASPPIFTTVYPYMIKKSFKAYDEKLIREEEYHFDYSQIDNYSGGVLNETCLCPFYKYLSKKETSEFFTGTGPVRNTYNFSYSPEGVIESQTNDFESRSYGYDSNNIRYRANTPMQITSSISGTVKYNYNTFGNRFQLAAIETSTPGEALETKDQYLYDDDGNLVTKIQPTPGSITPASYETTIWGYSNRFPVAMIPGLKYDAVFTAQTMLIGQIKALSARPVTTSNEMLLRNKLQELRMAYPDKMITTFTYNPVFGMTSTTDPKGQTTIYEYDTLGRPSFTKKEDPVTHVQFIVSENNYHTRSN